MNPTLLRLLSSLGPRAAGLLGLSGGAGAGLNALMGATSGDIYNDPGFMNHMKAKMAPPSAGAYNHVSPPISTSNYSPPMSPNDRVADAFGAMGSPMPSYGVPLPSPRPMGASMAQMPQGASVPTPQARPQEAPQMGFFQRNALMQKDNLTGQFLDPQGAASAQNSLAYSQGNGSDLIAKFLDYFHGKVPS